MVLTAHIWAMEVGEQLPQAIVVGNDLSPIQPAWVPPNMTFEVDDVEKPWAYAQSFSFVHVRAMYGSLKNRPRLFVQIFGSVEPGRFCEATDWERLRHLAAQHVHHRIYTGFTITSTRETPLPFGIWAKDRKLKCERAGGRSVLVTRVRVSAGLLAAASGQ